MEKEELLRLQQIELSMFKTIAEICGRHNIIYYALGGTLLGAVRHKGFIPWDDDIDLGVPRPQYEELLAILEEELPDHLQVMYFKKQKEAERPIYAAQVQNLNTHIIQHIANKPIDTHVWIDIFPLDGIPDNYFARQIHCFRLLYGRARIQFSMFDENVHQGRKHRKWYEKAAIKFYQITKFGSRSKPYDMMVRMDKLLKSYDYDKCDYLVNFMGAWKLKEMFPKKYYKDGIDYKFEDTYIHGPVDYDPILKQMYGNYLVPIGDPDEQIRHHDIEIVKL